jgi:hypothetical protein
VRYKIVLKKKKAATKKATRARGRPEKKMEQLIKRAQQLDEFLSRPIQQCVLPASIEFLLSWPGGILFGGSGSVKITYPVLIVLHFVWKPIAPSIAYSILLLAILITPAKSLGKRRVSVRSFHIWHLYF